jgi:hypothetical protein
MGTSPLFLVASAVYKAPRHPVLVGSLAMLWGYFSSAVKRAPRYDDPEFRRFLRRYQHASLLMGKAAAARRIEQQRERLWAAAHGAEAARAGPRASAPEQTDDEALAASP